MLRRRFEGDRPDEAETPNHVGNNDWSREEGRVLCHSFAVTLEGRTAAWFLLRGCFPEHVYIYM